MKKKTKHVIELIENLHNYIINDSQFRKDTRYKSETDIQREIRPLIINYLTSYFDKQGYSDSTGKANISNIFFG